jgi:hypothetical protein
VYQVTERPIFDVALLKAALEASARPYSQIDSSGSHSGEFIIYYLPENGREIEVFDSRSLSMLTDNLNNLFSASTPIDPDTLAEVLSSVALTISDGMLKDNESAFQYRSLPAVAYEVLADFAMTCIAFAARSCRHYIPIARIPRNDLAQALRRRNQPLLVRAIRTSLGLAQYPRSSGHERLKPIPRAFIAAPLTNMNDASHQVVSDQAVEIRKLLNSLGMVVVAPSPHLTPSKRTDEPAYELYRLERLLISGCDLVIAVGAEHDSWGMSRTISWAEASGCITIVLSGKRFLSRVLDDTSHRTYRLSIEEDPERQISNVRSHLNEILLLIDKHTRDRIAILGRLYQPIAEARRHLAALDKEAYEDSLLSEQRARELLDNPVMIDNCQHPDPAALHDQREIRPSASSAPNATGLAP